MKTWIGNPVPLARAGWRALVVALGEFQTHNGFETAAALTFFTLLAMVPLLVISLSVISQFAFSEEAFYNLISHYFFPTSGLQKAILPYLQSFAENTATLSILGGFFLIITSISLLNTVEGVFDRVWGVNRNRSLAQKFYSFWTLITLAPFLLAGALLLSSKMMMYPVLGSVLQVPIIQALLGYILPFLMTLLATFILYRAFSPPEVTYRATLYGAVLVTVLFQTARWGFALYLTRFATYREIYGILWTLPAFFLWIYLCWLIFLVGADVSGVVQFRLAGTGRRSGKEFTAFQALKLMMAVVGGFYSGKGSVSRGELEEILSVHPGVLDEILTRLREKNFIAAVSGPEARYLPARSPAQIPLLDLVSAVQGDPFRLPQNGTGEEDGADRAIYGLFSEARQNLDRVLGLSLEDVYRASTDSGVGEELTDFPRSNR